MTTQDKHRGTHWQHHVGPALAARAWQHGWRKGVPRQAPELLRPREAILGFEHPILGVPQGRSSPSGRRAGRTARCPQIRAGNATWRERGSNPRSKNLLAPPSSSPSTSRCVHKRLRALPVAAWRDRKWCCPGPCAACTVPVAAELERVRAGGVREAGLSGTSAALRDPGSPLRPQPARGWCAWVSGEVGCEGPVLGLRGGRRLCVGVRVSVVCVCGYVCIGVRVRALGSVCVYVMFACACIYMSVSVCSVCVCRCVCMHLGLCVCINVCIYVCAYA